MSEKKDGIADSAVVESLVSYLGQSGPSLLDADEEKFKAALGNQSSQQNIKNFVAHDNLSTLIIRKQGAGDDESYSVELEIRPTSNGVSVAFIKACSILNVSTAMSQQLHVCQLSDENPFHAILTYVRHYFLPYSTSIADAGKDDAKSNDDLEALRGVSVKLRELEVELYNSQQTIEIPLITLEPNKEVEEFVSQNKGKKLNPAKLKCINDNNFLNAVQMRLNEWKDQIRQVTNMNRDVNAGSTLQEINFWVSMEKARNHIYDEKESDAVTFSFDILKHKRRNVVTFGFMKDVGLAENRDKDTVSKHTNLLKELPIQGILDATSIVEIHKGIEAIFKHLQKIRSIDYPLKRVIKLMHAVTRDVVPVGQVILTKDNPMELSLPEFEALTKDCMPMFLMWGKEIEKFNSEIKDLAKQRSVQDFKIPTLPKPYTELESFRKRVFDVRKIRKEHTQLESVVKETLASEPLIRDTSLKSIGDAYEFLRAIEVFSCSDAVFEQAEKLYAAKINTVESELNDKIQRLLDAAQDDANEMFRICAKFHPLFVRPMIAATIRKYQDQLLQTVKQDIEKLKMKYKKGYNSSQDKNLSSLRDLPPVSGAIIWARQLERQLDTYTSRVQQTLGAGWVTHPDGRQLKKDTDYFRQQLDPTPLFEAWKKSTQAMLQEDEGQKIFALVEATAGLSLEVNFDERLITLFKEVRNLNNLGNAFRAKYQFKIAADEAKEKYPSAMRLGEVIRIYNRTSRIIESEKKLEPLAAVFKNRIQDTISKGQDKQWDSYAAELRSYVDKLGTDTLDYQDQVDELRKHIDDLFISKKKLSTCAPIPSNFKEILKELQDIIEQLDKGGYSNLNSWVKTLDEEVQDVLVERMQTILNFWVRGMELQTDDKEGDLAAINVEIEEEKKRHVELEKLGDLDTEDKVKLEQLEEKKAAVGFTLDKPIQHCITIKDQILIVDPPLEESRLILAKEIQRWIKVIAQLPRLRCFWQGGNDEDAEVDYSNALGQMKCEAVIVAYKKIDEKINAASKYVDTWLEYQALWDMDIEMITSKIGDDLSGWKKLLLDMKSSRCTFDNSSTQERFGPILVDYKAVQTKVNHKYDVWHKKIQNTFGELVGSKMKGLNESLIGARKQLQKFPFDFTTTESILSSVTLLQQLNKSSKQWSTDLTTQKGVEGVLQRQRYAFPEDWINAEKISDNMKSFETILNRKLVIMAKQAKNIQEKITRESHNLALQVEEFVEAWKENKPTDMEDADYEDVADGLESFSERLDDIKDKVLRMEQAKDALEMKYEKEERLVPIIAELAGLQEMWTKLGDSFAKLHTLGEQKFVDVKGKDLRKSLAKLQTELTRLPRSYRQYQGFDNLKQKVKNYHTLCANVIELGGGVLRPKHERQILKLLDIRSSWQDMSINELWAADLKKNADAIRHILAQAQGESALEEFLLEVKNQWMACKFDLVDYRNKCFLNKNFDELFEVIGTNVSDLQSMKNSPFFGAFEAESNRWESTLNRAQAIFDIFIEVQRRWVYLEGIFHNSQEVQVQLPYQYKKFNQFDKDFIKLMRDIRRDETCDYWVKDERGLLPQVTEYIETLDGIQKALSDYLEKQRAKFPRFYFVGDDDLLEIIGNANELLKILRHFVKMFAGVSCPTYEGNTITGFRSKEGEEVMIKKQIDVEHAPSINEWLTEFENQMRFSLAALLDESLQMMKGYMKGDTDIHMDKYLVWVASMPAQVCMLSVQVDYCETVEAHLTSGKSLDNIEKRVVGTLEKLADQILTPGLQHSLRKKYEQLITEYVHQRDVTRRLKSFGVEKPGDYHWLENLRFYCRKIPKDVDLKCITGDTGGIDSTLIICVSRARFYYGWEYQGVGERLVTTPLTDRCYLTLCEAMHMRMGANPYGPAGTGKTESVKSLGNQLGRFVLVFCCDENFDFNSMGRIFVGLCQVGAWGCFDEFNRLEEKILSAVSQQILTIQTGLQEGSETIELLNKIVKLNSNLGIFVTMNPGYAGRSALPDNLKQLFRAMAMVKPDAVLIGQVMLFSQGFRTAEQVASKVVLLFSLCKDQLSTQSHYDFGLRALKSVLRAAGNLKRKLLIIQRDKGNQDDINPEIARLIELDLGSVEGEENILVKSICGTIVPKLVLEDVNLFNTLLTAVFPTATVSAPIDDELVAMVRTIAAEDDFIVGQDWLDKLMQLDAILKICHGVICVGPASTGKSSCWRTLRKARERVLKVHAVKKCEKRKKMGEDCKPEIKQIVEYVIDPKALTKAELYGALDPTTLEWTDGVFTHVIRKIIDNIRGEQKHNHWVLFDGDVDPEWCENLNSVLDDNKMLTLPNGERLGLTENIRVMFEVQDLNYATLATVSRCGMVWFSENVVSIDMLLHCTWLNIKNQVLGHIETTVYNRHTKSHLECAMALKKYFVAESKDDDDTDFLKQVLEYCENKEHRHMHVMVFSAYRALMSTMSMIKYGIGKVIIYNDENPDDQIGPARIEKIFDKYLPYTALWGFCGDMSLKFRLDVGEKFYDFGPGLPLPPPNKDSPLIDWEPLIENGEWQLWDEKCAVIDLAADKVIKPDQMISTIDTTRHNDVVGSWLADHRPLLLCGPPGSGKSMTLTSVLNAMPQFELVTINFSSTTGIDLIMQILTHYCQCDKTPKGYVMRPPNRGKWLAVFCDEINLPADDVYATVAVITFLRQLTELGGFWRAEDLVFVKIERIQIIGACNPPEDAGRVAIHPRFLRHCPLMFVDFPSRQSLKQIYGTFCRALLKLQPHLKSYGDPMTEAMVEVYTKSQQRFTPDVQPHYIYSPRELSRWTRAMYGAIMSLGGTQMTAEELVRLWAHEALRLFSDRLTTPEENQWTDRHIDNTAKINFPGLDMEECLHRPILYSSWLTNQMESVEPGPLTDYIKERLLIFRDEELDIKLVIFNEVLEHILRIDRVLRQPLGHLLLVGSSGSGKTVLSKFVSWMGGLSTFQIKVHKQYTAEDFDLDLRTTLVRSGCHHEKICFIFDESNVLDSAFLERMNSLLASGEVPGLFEGSDWTALMDECKQSASRDNVSLSTEEEFYKRFCKMVQNNLHIVFTMNPKNEDFDNREATAPALYNRCVIDWFGEWSTVALYQVGHEFTTDLPISDGPPGSKYVAKDEEFDDDGNLIVDEKEMKMGSGTERDNVVLTLCYVHQSIYKVMLVLKRNTGKRTYITPRHYLDFINQYVSLWKEKEEELGEGCNHLSKGLQKLKDTQASVAKMQIQLKDKGIELKAKEANAETKLKQIMKDQEEIEKKKVASEAIKVQIDQQTIDTNARKDKIAEALANAEPALQAAKAAVGGISKKDLDQVKSYANPPAQVQRALEPIGLMLGLKDIKWKSLKAMLAKRGFKEKIMNYEVKQLKPKIAKKIQKQYLSDVNFNYDIVKQASKACAPLVLWVSSMISYAGVKNSVEPLMAEMVRLEKGIKVLAMKMDELKDIQKALGEKIQSLKQDYAQLVKEANRTKNEMIECDSKVTRAVSLLKNLSSEDERWGKDVKGYQKELSTLIGDCLLTSAFLAYIGYFNQAYRSMLMEKWAGRLNSLKIPCKENLSVIEYLSSPGERLEWGENGLPPDDLCVENAIMLRKFNRYPLIIDPSGQATDFLLQAYKKRKIERTSFLDDDFLKKLETSLRFGNALLVDDVGSIDPTVNSVLNKEIFRQGGRVMITLGAKEIDFSPSFVIFLATRDPNALFTPDLCSRVTFVNFTVTPSSLSAQCLSKVLKAERPDVDAQRTSLMKLQGEFRVRLRKLEDGLLASLNSAKGNLLDNDKVIADLERLKKEAGEINAKMEESREVLEEIERVSIGYKPFATICAGIYFTLEKLGHAHFLYQFSLAFFLDAVNNVLTEHSPELAKLKDPDKRFKQLCVDIFNLCFSSVARGLMNKDQLAYAMRLAQVALGELAGVVFSGAMLDAAEVDFLLKGSSKTSKDPGSYCKKLGLTAQNKSELSSVISFPNFDKLDAHISANIGEWTKWMDSIDGLEKKEPEENQERDRNVTPNGWEKGSTPSMKLWAQLLTCRCLRPDLVPNASREFVCCVFGDKFFDNTSTELEDFVRKDERKEIEPYLFVSLPGYDASGRVVTYAAKCKAKLQAFAMGSPEGYALADAAIDDCARKGGWVLLKNVHLSPGWLGELEKRLHRKSGNSKFKLFLTMEMNPKVPSNLFRMSTVVIFEPPVGLKASLVRTYGSMSKERVNKKPKERGRLYFLLAWLHSIILERLRYQPVGWTKSFEFGESDLKCAMNALDEWIDKVAQGKSNVKIEKIPWDALQALFEKVLYGGRVDNRFDQFRLAAFVQSLWQPESFDEGFALSQTWDDKAKKLVTTLEIPDGRDYDDFKKWIEALPTFNSPELLGLPSNADIMLSTKAGADILDTLLHIQDQDAGGEIDVDLDDTGGSSGGGGDDDVPELPEWMTNLLHSVKLWIDACPKAGTLIALPKGKEAAKLVLDPLYRSMMREYNAYRNLLDRVCTDLKNSHDGLSGIEDVNNQLRAILNVFRVEKLPKTWAIYGGPRVLNTKTSLWIPDFNKRVGLMKLLGKTPANTYGSLDIWLGGFMFPAAFVAASKQAVAMYHKWSLDDLTLKVTVDDKSKKVDCYTFVEMRLTGAGWGKKLCMNDATSFLMPPMRFTWIKQTEKAKDKKKYAIVPVYLDDTRTKFLFHVELERPNDIPINCWYQRGVSLSCWC